MTKSFLFFPEGLHVLFLKFRTEYSFYSLNAFWLYCYAAAETAPSKQTETNMPPSQHPHIILKRYGGDRVGMLQLRMVL